MPHPAPNAPLLTCQPQHKGRRALLCVQLDGAPLSLEGGIVRVLPQRRHLKGGRGGEMSGGPAQVLGREGRACRQVKEAGVWVWVHTFTPRKVTDLRPAAHTGSQVVHIFPDP